MDTEEVILKIKEKISQLKPLDDFSQETINDLQSIKDYYDYIITQASKKSFFIFCKYILNIRNKAQQLVPFILQQTQLNSSNILIDQLKESRKNRTALLKGRQAGLSTLIPAYAFWLYLNKIPIKGLLIGLNDESNRNLFKSKVRDLYHNMNPVYKVIFCDNENPLKENEHEIVLNNDFAFTAKSYNSKDSGRSGTFNFIWFTECSYYSLKHVEGAINAIASNNNTFIIAETTANGMGSLMYDIYQQVNNNPNSIWKFYFDGWWNVPDYQKQSDCEISEFAIQYRNTYNPNLTDAQLRWLDDKFFDVGRIEERLHAEFPPNPEVAFASSSTASIINMDTISRALSNENPFIPEYIPIVLGIDIGFNNDKTVIALKRGKYIEIYDDFIGGDTGNIVNKIYNAIIDLSKNWKIAHVNIDSVGVGRGVFDDLKRMTAYSHNTISINMINGGSATDDVRYPSKNLNALLIYKLKEWLEDPEAKIKDNPQLNYELCNLKTEFRENGILCRIDKEEAKKTGGKSPDYADAVLYTFAYDIPNYMFDPIEQKRREQKRANTKSWDQFSVFDNW